MNKYLDYVDLAKGFGILLVIMGHSLFPLHLAIDIFHMPLFFFISGITFSFRRGEDVGKVFLKKIERILIPLFFFAFLSGIFEVFLKPVDKTPFNEPLWFLKVIFCVLVLYYLICYFFKNEKQKSIVVLVLAIFGFVFAYFDVKLFLDFDLTLVSMSFLHLGFLFKERYKSMQLKTTLILILICVLFYVIGLYFLIQGGANGAYLFRLYKYSFVLFYITAISGIILVLSISKIFVKIPIINYLGKNSLIVLCVHFPLVQRLNVYVSKLDLYNYGGIQGKFILGISIYIITIFFSFLCIEFFRKFIPKLTGFQQIFKL